MYTQTKHFLYIPLTYVLFTFLPGSYESFRSIAATIKPQHVCAVKRLPLRVILKPLIGRDGSTSDNDSAASGVTVAVLQRPVLCTESRPLPRSWDALPSAQSPAANHNTSTATPSEPPHTDGDGGGEGGGGEGGGEGDEEGWKAPGDREKMDSGGGTLPEKQQSSMETTYGTTQHIRYNSMATVLLDKDFVTLSICIETYLPSVHSHSAQYLYGVRSYTFSFLICTSIYSIISIYRTIYVSMYVSPTI